jgi:hypothetical protein
MHGLARQKGKGKVAASREGGKKPRLKLWSFFPVLGFFGQEEYVEHPVDKGEAAGLQRKTETGR